MPKHILIQLKPFDYYFFGGEETFNSGTKGVTNYHVKSNRLPQQTGLLGLLRHAMLEAGYDIGSSFNGANTNFGVVNKISPLFLTDANGHRYLPAPSNINNKQEPVEIMFRNDAVAFMNGRWQEQSIVTKKYDAKKGLGTYWLNTATGVRLPANDIFLSKDHVGINKEKQLATITDEGGFYKQEFITMDSEYSFAFIAEVADKVELSKLPLQLPFGGERRSFQLSYSDASGLWDSIKSDAKKAYKEFTSGQYCIILLSDAYVENINKFTSMIIYGITEEVPFRNIITPSSVTNFGGLTRDEQRNPDKMYKQKVVRYLYKKGSVLFFDTVNAGSVTEALDKPVFQSIGYNHYLHY